MNDLLLRIHIWVQVFANSEKGQDLTEYGLLVALISLLAVAATQNLAMAFNNAFQRVSTTLA
jgi:Flp pilus assembly pilin Flp